MFSAAAACFIFSAIGLGYRPVLQIIAVICIVIGIQITTRYRLCVFTYIIGIDSAGNDPDTVGSSPDHVEKSLSLTVVRTQGNHSNTIAVLPLSGVIATEKKISHAQAEKKYGVIKHYYNFCANLFSPDARLLILKYDNNQAGVLIEPDERILGYLNK
jgi:hypothetical protein